MISKLVVHPRTKEQVAQFLLRPSQAVILVGNNGTGKTALAKAMIAEALSIGKSIEQYPYLMVVSPEKDVVPIDAIREVQRFLQLKTTGINPIRRAVIIEHAELLTVEAQNAFLKLLEEPPADTILALTADNPQALLPTILSRVQLLAVHAPSEEALKSYFATKTNQPEAINQAYFLSGGLPGVMEALLNQDITHPLITAVTGAKEILQKSLFERLAMVETLSKRKEDARYVVRAMQHIAQTCLTQAAAQGNEAKLKQWHKILRVATTTEQALTQNANVKLTLSNMMLNL